MENILIAGIWGMIFLGITYKKMEWGWFLLFLLLPTYLIRFKLGPLPSTVLEVMVLILIVMTLLNSIKSKEKVGIKSLVSNNKFLLVSITLLLLGATVSIFTSVDIKKALGEWRAFFVEPILLFFALVVTLKNRTEEHRKKLIDLILFALITSGLVTSILAIYQHFTGWMVPHAFWANRDTYRVTAWYGFPNGVGLFLAPLIPLALYLLKKYSPPSRGSWRGSDEAKNAHPKERPHLTSPHRGGKILVFLISNFQFLISLLFLVSAPLALLFAKGSGPMIGVLAGIGVLLLYYKKTRIPALILGVLGVISIFLLPASNSYRQEILFQDRSAQLRLDMWKETKEFLQDNPVFGAGLASYEEKILSYRKDKRIEVFHHPHNIFLTMWVNTGIIGFIGFVLLLIWFFVQALKKNTLFAKFLLSTMVVIVVMGLVDSPYIKNDLAILFWLLPALLLVHTPQIK